MTEILSTDFWVSTALRLPTDEDERVRGIVVRTALMFGAAGALLVVSRNGMSPYVIAAASTVYVVMTTLWVHGQYMAALQHGRMWTPHPLLSLLGVGIFGLGLCVGWISSTGYLVIGSLVFLLYCFGYFAMGLRSTEESSRPGWLYQGRDFWLIVLAGAFVAGIAGLLLLEHSGLFSLLLLAVALIVVPVAISVLTSRFHDHLSNVPAEDFRSWSLISLGGGLLLVAVGAAWALHGVGDPVMGAGIVLLVLLVFALVSSTYADIALIIAVIAALGVTAQQQPRDESALLGKENTRVLVAFGDSYMSGEGATSFHAETDTTDNHCRRATTAFAEMAGQLNPFDGFISFACSGARTYNVNHDAHTDDGKYPQEQYPGIMTQLDAYDDEVSERGFTPTLVLVGLGGNDAGFATVGAMCLAPGNCGGGESNDPDSGIPDEDEGDAEDLLLTNLPLVEQQLRVTFDEISDEFDGDPGVPVAVVGYPDPIYNPAPGVEPAQDCSGVPLSGDDRDFVEDLLAGLNGLVSRAATDAGFYYVGDSVNALAEAHLQLCDPRNDGRAGVNVAGIQSVPGEANERFNPKNWYHNSLHPNERGHVAMLVAFEKWLSDHEWPLDPKLLPRGRAVEGTDLQAVAAAAADAKCQQYKPAKVVDSDTFPKTYSNLPTCENAGYLWAGGQVSDALLVPGWWGLRLLLVAVGAWLIAVTLFAWQRRRWIDRAVTDDPLPVDDGHRRDSTHTDTTGGVQQASTEHGGT